MLRAHRLEWEMSINNGEKNFMSLEEERLLRLKEYANHVWQCYQTFVPKIAQVRDGELLYRNARRVTVVLLKSASRYQYNVGFQISSRLGEPIYECDVSKDFAIVADTVNRYEDDLSVQVLPDFYAEHTNLAMNKKRRITVRRRYILVARGSPRFAPSGQGGGAFFFGGGGMGRSALNGTKLVFRNGRLFENV